MAQRAHRLAGVWAAVLGAAWLSGGVALGGQAGDEPTRQTATASAKGEGDGDGDKVVSSWMFDDAKEGGLPEGWIVPMTLGQAGWKASVVSGGQGGAGIEGTGGKCVELARVPVEGKEAPFGNVMLTMDAKALRGKKVTVSAAVRVSGADGGRAQLWIRVDRANGASGYFDNMGDRPILTREFSTHTVGGLVDDDAESINFGLMVVGGNGPAQLDNVMVRMSEPLKKRFAVPQALTEGGQQNLMALAKVVGYLRHYHPSDQCAAVNWDALTIDAVLACEGAESAESLAAAMNKVFSAYAPTVRIQGTAFNGAFDPGALTPEGAKGTRVTWWHHRGFGGPSGSAGMVYTSARQTRGIEEAPKEGEPKIGDVIERVLAVNGGSVYVRVPLVVVSDGKGTLPLVKMAKPESAGTEPTGEDRATRLAGVILAWNVCQHFYPYFDVVRTEWDEALPTALSKAAEDRESKDFVETLRGLAAMLKDGHGSAYSKQPELAYVLPINAMFVGEELVVTAASMGAEAKCKPGDRIVSIAGRSVEELVADARRYEAASTDQFFKSRTIFRLLSRPTRDALAMKFKTAEGQDRSSAIRPEEVRFWPRVLRPEPMSEVKPGVVYLDVDRVDAEMLKEGMSKLEGAKGIIVDVRGYPARFPWTFLGQLTDTMLKSPQWHVPVCDFPDSEGRRFEQSGWPIPASKPRLGAKVVFIIDGRAISAAETFMGIVSHHQLGEIVGEATAGTNGNVNPVALPGGFTFNFTGMKVLTQEGKQHHGIGIQPTVAVSPTIAGIAAGRDELLEKAIEIAMSGDGAKKKAEEPKPADAAQPTPGGDRRD